MTLALTIPAAELGPCAIVPRGYQARAVNELRAEIARGARRVLLVAPTGAGKTLTASLVIRSAIEKGGDVLVLAHRSELLDQMYATCERVGIPRAWLQVIRGGDKRRNPGARVHVASVDTLRNWVGTGRLPKVRVIIIDEAHRSAAAGYVKIREAYPDAIVIGLTATPWRLDGKALDALYDASVVVASIPELVAQGALVPVRCFTHPKGPDLSGVKTKGGDFDQEQAASVMRSRILLGSVVEEYLRRASGRAAFGFACNVAHAQELAQVCRDAGITSVAIHGESEERERRAALDGLRDGSVKIVWNAALFTEGTDVPQVKCVILARPTLSKALAFQMLGRGMRPCPETGFADCVLLDHAGVLPIHGHPMEPQDYSLTTAKAKASGPAQTKNCPSCGETVALGTTLCACGHVWERAEREGPTVVPGKLEEVAVKPPLEVTRTQEAKMIRVAFAIAAKRSAAMPDRYALGILRKQLRREPSKDLFDGVRAELAPRVGAPKKVTSVEVLAAIEEHGDVNAAASALGVHPTTVARALPSGTSLAPRSDTGHRELAGSDIVSAPADDAAHIAEQVDLRALVATMRQQLSLRDLATRLGIGHATLGRYESGEREIPEDVAARIRAQADSVRAEYIADTRSMLAKLHAEIKAPALVAALGIQVASLYRYKSGEREMPAELVRRIRQLYAGTPVAPALVGHAEVQF